MNQAELKEQLHYDPCTGIFTRLRTFRSVKAGDIAGHADHKTRYGYIRISVCGASYQAHRLAFLYMWGYIPEEEIDHIDHNTGNNMWTNLRIVSHKENGKNQKKYTSNTSGITGVRQRENGKWRARIYFESKHIQLGDYINKEDAVSARKDAEIKYKFHRKHGV